MNILWLSLLPSGSVVWVLVASAASDVATRGRRDSSVYVPAIEAVHHCDPPSEGLRALARVLAHSEVGTNGCRNHESRLASLCYSWAGWPTSDKS